jgi:hypothetical protein
MAEIVGAKSQRQRQVSLGQRARFAGAGRRSINMKELFQTNSVGKYAVRQT